MTPPVQIRGATGAGSGLSRVASADNLEKAGQKFEAVFTGMMLKAARKAKLADPLFDSQATDMFREMQDTQLAQVMAERHPIGIGKAMADFLRKSQADLNPQPSEPPA